jgi:enolase
VNKAIFNVNTKIAEKLKGKNAFNQEEIDKVLIELDGTPNKSRLGGNALIATSLRALGDKATYAIYNRDKHNFPFI